MDSITLAVVPLAVPFDIPLHTIFIANIVYNKTTKDYFFVTYQPNLCTFPSNSESFFF